MIRAVVRLPDPVLARPAVLVGPIDDDALSLGADLLDTMAASAHCVGLAAPQIGVSLRAFCLDVTGHRRARSVQGPIVVLDPFVVGAEGAETAREGCMSVPDLTGDVTRATCLVIGGFGLDGAPVTYEMDAFEARAAQHELDHLDGLLFLDRVASHRDIHRRRVYR